MQFIKFASYLSRLEQTTKRLELIDVISEMYLSVKTAEDAQRITYLVQGRVAPFYAPIEFGMGDKLILRAIATSSHRDLTEVDELYSQLGDIGLVAVTIVPVSHSTQESVEYVFDTLYSITQISGEGSVDGKVGILSALLSHIGPEGAKYIVRIVAGNLRLGIGDPTVMESLALARLGNRTYRKNLEKAYNETSDLGIIAKTLWGFEGDAAIEAIEKLRLSVGRPLRSELCERLPNAEKTIEKMGSVVSQFKYDGFRTQMHLDRKKGIVKLYSRNLEETTHAFPELLQGILDQVDAESVILDSEALAYHPDSEEFFVFQETTKRRRKHGIAEMAQALPLRAFVFDILYKNGEPLIDLPVKERLQILEKTVKQNVYPDKSDTLIVSESRFISEAKPLGLMLEESLTKGLEGLVIKKVDSPYEAGARNFNWVKLKHTASDQLKDTVDCVVLGYIFGKGKRTAFGVGALLVGVYDPEQDIFVSISKIGTGLTDEEWVQVRERCDTFVSKEKPARIESEIVPSVWVLPEVVIEVLADEITRSPSHTAGKVGSEPGYALRFPRLVSFRDADKRPEDATNVEEIKELYSMQGKKD
jgi:DNA ligase-1